MLLSGENALWLLHNTGKLEEVVKGAGITAYLVSPSDDQVAYVQNNDIYTVSTSDGNTQQLTTDGGETVYNGTLDWV